MKNNEAVHIAALQSKFAPVFAIKASALNFESEKQKLTASEHRAAWEKLNDALSLVVSHCAGFSNHTDSLGYPNPLVLWDFLNGRSLQVEANVFGGYDLLIHAEEMRWTETQLPLELLMLKVLALDYTPREFRDFAS